MLNALKVVFFGQQMNNEIHNVSHAIEFSFDQYRQNLINIMKSFEEVIDRLDQVDRLTNCKFAETHTKIKSVAAQYPTWWEHNEMTLRKLIIPADLHFVYAILPGNDGEVNEYIVNEPVEPHSSNHTKSKNEEENREVASYNSMIQLIIHISRDWSAAGIKVRQKLYNEQIISKLLQYLPLPTTNSTAPSVLVPGAGVGRLAWELASLGYRVEANECSATMVSFMNKLFNDILPSKKQLTIYPYLHLLFQDDWDLEMRSTMINLPYIDDAYHQTQPIHHHNNDKSKGNTLTPSGSLSVQYGDFVRIYGQSKDYQNQYDAIITNFFIDTGKNIIDYLQTIEDILKPNGIWINLGPLHYHNKQSIPYSYKHLMEIIQAYGFHILSYDTVENSYCGEEKISMKPEVYNIPVNVFQLRGKGKGTNKAYTYKVGHNEKLEGKGEEENGGLIEEEIVVVKILNEENLCDHILDEGKLYDESPHNQGDDHHQVKFTRPNYKVIH